MFNHNGLEKNIYKKLKAFTLVELLVGTIISSVILLGVFSMTSDVLDEAVFTNKSIATFSSLYDIEKEFNNYKNIYSTGNILIDNSSGNGSDVFLFLNTDNSEGYLVGIVNNYTRQLVPSSEYFTYKDNSLGFRKLTGTGIINSIMATPSLVYSNTYLFQKDKINQDFKLRDLQITLYNQGVIKEFNFNVNMFFNDNLVGDNWNDIGNDKLVNFTLNF